MRKRWLLAIVGGLLASGLVLGAPSVAPTFLLRWGSYGVGAGQFRHPGGVALDREGNLYVADVHNGRIQKFTPQGQYVNSIGSTGSGIGQLLRPRDVEVGPDGNLYVADTENNRVQVFSQDGTWLRTWGDYGGGPGQMSEPWGIAIDQTGNVYVADPGSSRIQKFDLMGNLLLSWDGGIVDPDDVEVGPNGDAYVIDTGARVKQYTPQGGFIRSWSCLGDGYGTHTTYLAIAPDGHVWVTDPQAVNKIMEFSATGTLLNKWGNAGAADGQFSRPTGIQVDTQGNIYIVESDDTTFGSGRQDVQKFTLVPTPATRMHWGELKIKYR